MAMQDKPTTDWGSGLGVMKQYSRLEINNQLLHNNIASHNSNYLLGFALFIIIKFSIQLASYID